MKRVMKQGIVILLAAMFLTGCGQKVTKLTTEEEALLVNYSAGTLAKYNKYQEDGLTTVTFSDEEKKEEAEADMPQEEAPKEPEQIQTDTAQGSADTEQQPQEGVRLTDVFAIPSIEISYVDYALNNNYEQSGYFSMEAPKGKTCMVFHFKLTNTSAQAVSCDILNRKPIFTLKLNSQSAIKNEVTILPNDLSTFCDTIQPGATVDTVLIYEVSEAEAANIVSVQTNVQLDGTNHEIVL
ncbi:MAG: hypothetical protein RR139_08485 [Lachnospiraceae bacterium]